MFVDICFVNRNLEPTSLARISAETRDLRMTHIRTGEANPSIICEPATLR